MSNNAISRKTHAPDSHQQKLLPWLCLLSQWPWKIQATAGPRVEWQLEWHMEWQWSNIRSVGRVIWSYKIRYNCSMLEYKVIKFPPWLFSMMSNTTIGKKIHAPDSHQWKLLPSFCFLRWRPWIFQMTAGATVEWQLKWQWSNGRSFDAIGRKTHAVDIHWLKLLPWLCLFRRQLWTIQAIAGATAEWQLEWQRSNIRSVGRAIWRHRISYNCSML